MEIQLAAVIFLFIQFFPFSSSDKLNRIYSEDMDVQIAPLRTLDDFILASSRYEPEKFLVYKPRT